MYREYFFKNLNGKQILAISFLMYNWNDLCLFRLGVRYFTRILFKHYGIQHGTQALNNIAGH